MNYGALLKVVDWARLLKTALTAGGAEVKRALREGAREICRSEKKDNRDKDGDNQIGKVGGMDYDPPAAPYKPSNTEGEK